MTDWYDIPPQNCIFIKLAPFLRRLVHLPDPVLPFNVLVLTRQGGESSIIFVTNSSLLLLFWESAWWHCIQWFCNTIVSIHPQISLLEKKRKKKWIRKQFLLLSDIILVRARKWSNAPNSVKHLQWLLFIQTSPGRMCVFGCLSKAFLRDWCVSEEIFGLLLHLLPLMTNFHFTWVVWNQHFRFQAFLQIYLLQTCVGILQQVNTNKKFMVDSAGDETDKK